MRPHAQAEFAALTERYSFQDLEAALATKRFRDFIPAAWPLIDTHPFVGDWYIDAIADHLEAVSRGQIRRLLINLPPRCAKSNIAGVLWPAWVWGQSPDDPLPLMGPKVQWFNASYEATLTQRDAIKMRRLIQTDWYQRYFATRYIRGEAGTIVSSTWHLMQDQNRSDLYANSAGGHRLSTSVRGKTTGEGGDVIVFDDPHNVKSAESDATRLGTLSWWDEAMPTRLNNPQTGAKVGIMQRVHTLDLVGHILEKAEKDDGEEFVHLCLPMEYEPKRHCITVPILGSPFSWEDPRTKEGQLLAPKRFNRAAVESLARSLGPYAAAGQLQQRPEPRGGGIFKRHWWQPWEHKYYPPFVYLVGSLDTAYESKQENDWSAFTLWGVFMHQDISHVMLVTAWQERLDLHPLVMKTGTICRKFKVDRLLVEAKASGISVIQELHRLFKEDKWHVERVNPRDDKVARAYGVQNMWSNGLVWAPVGRRYVSMVVDEMASFPKGHDDLNDTAVQAIQHLRKVGILKLPDEALAERLAEASIYGAEEKLYDV